MPADDGMTPPQKRRLEDLLEDELSRIRGERPRWLGLTFDRKISVGNLLSIVLMLLAVFQAYVTLAQRFTLLEYQVIQIGRGQDNIEKYLGIWDGGRAPR